MVTPKSCFVGPGGGLQVRAVIIENTFLSVSHMVDAVLPFLTRVKPFVLRLKWNSEERVRLLKRPVLYISGTSAMSCLFSSP